MKTIPILLIVVFSTGCQQSTAVLDDIKRKQKLIVVTRNAPTTYYDWHDEPTGPEYEMTQDFARALGVDVEYVLKDSTADILATLEAGQAHIAAAGLTRTAEREQKFNFGPTYQYVQQQVVCRRGGKNPKEVKDLINTKLVVSANTSYTERLGMLKQEIPELGWLTTNEEDTETLLEQVWEKKIDCTIADSNITAINRRYYPELQVKFSISKPEPVAWMLPANADGLLSEIQHWAEEYTSTGKKQALFDKYYGFIEVFDYVDTRKFIKRIYTVLPKYRVYFEHEAKQNGFDWTLLAAQAYQESHWRTKARSPTGVRGIMMLTQTTARELGVENRLDAQQSIKGGARYLNRLTSRIPEEVPSPDRLWFALAAYNVGMGHLFDARSLANELGKNPNSWSDLSEVLPLLGKRKYYTKLKHGYARGQEPVNYVQHIRDYQNILLQRLNHH